MKKVLFLAAAVACTTFSFAQEKKMATSSAISFGVKAGVNLSNFSESVPSGEDKEDFSSKIGLNAGVFATFHLSNSFAIQPELTWSTMGVKEKEDGSDAKMPLNYLTLPVLAKYTFAGSGFSLYAGPQVGFLLSAKVKGDGASVDIKDSFKSTDFGAVAGLEFEIPNTKLNISGRYQFGLANIAKDAPDGYKLKNTAATFTVGYRLF